MVKPSIFGNKDHNTAECFDNYITIARLHVNNWIDILRHTQWMLKNYTMSPVETANMFKTKDLFQLRDFLGTLTPPILITIIDIDPSFDKIVYPSSIKSKREKVYQFLTL